MFFKEEGISNTRLHVLDPNNVANVHVLRECNTHLALSGASIFVTQLYV